MIRFRSICEEVFQKYSEYERIEKFSRPKVLRLLAVLRLYRPPPPPCVPPPSPPPPLTVPAPSSPSPDIAETPTTSNDQEPYPETV